MRYTRFKSAAEAIKYAVEELPPELLIGSTLEVNEERTEFYRSQELDPLPASTGIQAILCRPDLLIEIEAIAMIPSDRRGG